MPFYHCLVPPGLLDAARKQRIVDEITRIHCEHTGAPSLFVQVQFEEVPAGNAFQDGKPSNAVRLHGRIRAGRSAETKHGMLSAYTEMLSSVLAVPIVDVMVAMLEVPFENVMEAGVRLPRPGEEAAWLAQFAGVSSGRGTS